MMANDDPNLEFEHFTNKYHDISTSQLNDRFCYILHRSWKMI